MKKTRKRTNIRFFAVTALALALALGACDDSGSSNAVVGSTVPSFVAVGHEGLILISSNGTSWSDESEPGDTFGAVAYGNKTYAAVGVNGRITTSTDGETWTERKVTGEDGRLRDITYGGNRFVVVANSGICCFSDDGIEWSYASQVEGSPDLKSIAYGNNTFMTVGHRTEEPCNDVICTSSNGETWNQKFSQELGSDSFCGVAFLNGDFIVLTVLGIVYISDDNGDSWGTGTAISGCDFDGLSHITSGNNMFMASGIYFDGSTHNIILTSSNGETWSNAEETSVYSTVMDILYAKNKFFVAGDDEYIASSGDSGDTWVTRSQDLSGTQTIEGITYGGY